MDGLLNAALPLAQKMLQEHGEFYPYGVALRNDAKVEMLGGYTGQEHPRSDELLDLLVNGARQRASEFRATAFVSDVRLRSDQGDAIQVEIEHREGHAIAVLLPYKKAGSGQDVQYGQMAAAAARRQVWPSA